MKRIALFIVTGLLFLTGSFSAFGQKADFQGKWTLDREKSTLPANLPTLIGITINIKGDSLLTERVYDSNNGQEFPFNENLALDGTELKLTVYEMPRKTKATMAEMDSAVNLESTTTFNGPEGAADFLCKETWKVDKVSKILSISYKNTISGVDENGVFVFSKVEGK